jgi:hypothetical protein
MEGGTEHITGYNNIPLAQAVHIAQNSVGGVDRRLAAFLEKKLDEVWRRLRAKPDSYIFSQDEFALFNYYQSWFTKQDILRNAIKRYWDNHRA